MSEKKKYVIIFTAIAIVIVALGLYFLITGYKDSISEDIVSLGESKEELVRGSTLASEIERVSSKDNVYIVGEYSYGAKVEIDENINGKCSQNSISVESIHEGSDNKSAVYSKGSKQYIQPRSMYTKVVLCDGDRIVGAIYSETR